MIYSIINNIEYEYMEKELNEMNKHAQKLKAKRRAEREAAKNEKLNKIWDEMSKYNEEMGHPKMEKTKEQMLKVYRAKKDVDNKVLNKTGVISLVCSLVILYKHYQFDKQTILGYAGKLRNFIINIGKNKRPVSLLMTEIEQDYKVSILQRCQNLPQLKMNEFNKYNMDDTIIKSTVENFPYFIAINAYVFMNYLTSINNDVCWNSKDLEIFVSESFKLYKNILTDTMYLKTLNDILIDERDICVNLTTGTVSEIIK